MSAGISRSQKYSRTVRVLRDLGRKYNGTYKNWTVQGTFNGHNWSAQVNWGNMSNGESVGHLVFFVDGTAIPEYFPSENDIQKALAPEDAQS